MLIVAPMPPVGRAGAAGLVDLDRRDRFGGEIREVEGTRLGRLGVLEAEAGICRPFNSTRLKSGPTPRTVTREPSPIERSIDTPLMRCMDSARLVSGNLPMSSATMPSITPCASRFSSIEEVRLPRMPVTTTSSSSEFSCERAGSATAVPRIKEMARAIEIRLDARSLTAIPP